MTTKATNAKRRVMTGPQFRTWREARGYSLGKMAELFDVSKATIQGLDASGVSQIHLLAMAAIDAGIAPQIPEPQEATDEDEVAEPAVRPAPAGDRRRSARRDGGHPPAAG